MKKEYFISLRGFKEDEAAYGLRFAVDEGELQRVRDKVVSEGHEQASLQFDVNSFAFYRLITPADITMYRCKKCDKTYNEKPKVGVGISGIGTRKDRFVTARYDCTHCGECVFVTPIHSAEGIPAELIEFDATGNYKRPTPEAIEELFGRMEKAASEGVSFDELIETAKTWATKIAYTLPKDRIKQMQERRREVYLGNLEKALPQILDEIEERDYAWSIKMCEDDECTPYEGNGLDSRMRALLGLLSAGRIPQDSRMKKQILDALFRYEGMFRSRKRELQDEKKGLEKAIAEAEGDIVAARGLRHKFVDAAKLTREEISEVKDSVLR